VILNLAVNPYDLSSLYNLNQKTTQPNTKQQVTASRQTSTLYRKHQNPTHNLFTGKGFARFENKAELSRSSPILSMFVSIIMVVPIEQERGCRDIWTIVLSYGTEEIG